MSAAPDPRLTPALDGLAAASLEGLVPATLYRQPDPAVCVADVAPMLEGPDPAARRASELLRGEGFDVLTTRDGYAFGQARRDGYVGWVPEALLDARDEDRPPTHRVAVLRTLAFEAADLKRPVHASLSLNALLHIESVEDRWAWAPGLGFLPAHHLAPLGDVAADPATEALRFLGAPYLWGGRSSLGLDCSGLVQAAFHACGLACPRDADQQQAALGAPVDAGGAQRNDLVFWRGHVGLLLDADRLLHANAHAMAVTVEPLAEARARIAAASSGEATVIRPHHLP